MFKILPRFFLIVIFWVIFTFVVFQIPYPESFIQATLMQLLLFFIPLILALSTTINFFLKNIFVSFSISLGLISILVLKALEILNLVTGILTIITVGLLISYFRKTRRAGLTNHSKIPKLTGLKRG